ncbi:hypothetical protein ACFVP3_32080 [Streptomyces sp. NPDC057806]|uniref:hypothetical protein n=1 Tax=Streptomyces sp. NPDC057806 TaxID=3346255 RepID=UPI0036829C02
MTWMRTGGARAALLLALALAAAGCGSGGGTDEAADLAAGANAQEEKAVRFAECLAEHGVNVETGEGGGIRITGRVPKEKVDAAMEACRKYSPMQEGAGQDPEAEEQMRKLAQCMRDNGVEKFPDPEPGRGIRIGEGVADDPDFEAAQQKCDAYAPSDSRRSTETDGND